MEYWKTTVTILLPLLANIFSYWGLLRSGGLNTRKYWLVEVRRPQYEKILASRGDWEWLYCDSSRGIRWNIAWALGKSLGLRPRDFPRAQAIFHRIPLLSSQYSYSLKWSDPLDLTFCQSFLLEWILMDQIAAWQVQLIFSQEKWVSCSTLVNTRYTVTACSIIICWH